MKLRVRLAKEQKAKYLSHLDLQRTLERTLRRSGLPVAYTKGFSPHPRMSYASALATGTSSEGEFLDIELTQPVAPAEFVARLNGACPPGLRAVEAREAPGGDSLFSLLNAAAYRLELRGEPVALTAAVAAFLAAPAVEVLKESKRGMKLVNIRDMVFHLAVGPRLEARGGAASLEAVLQCSPEGSLKPETLLAGLRKVAPALGDAELLGAHRLMLYRREPETGRLLDPWALV